MTNPLEDRKPLFDLWESASAKSRERDAQFAKIIDQATDNAVLTVKIRVGDLPSETRSVLLDHAGYLHLKEADGTNGVLRDMWGTSAPTLIAGISAQEKQLIMEGKKIQAIKACRERTGQGLKDAKELIEKAMKSMGL